MITIVKPDQSYSRHNVTFQCPCGRSLRAKIEAAGTEIQCWDCHRMVYVPFPRSVDEAVRALRKAWDDVFESWGRFGLLVGMATVATALLLVPQFGGPLAISALVAAAFTHGALIRHAHAAELAGEARAVEDAERVSPLRWGARGVAALLFGVGLSAPFLLARAGVGRSAQLTGLLVPGIVTAVMALAPLAMLAAFAPSGPRIVPAVLRWRSRSLLLSLAVLPLSLVLLECALVFATFFLGVFGGLLLDLTTPPPFVLSRLRVPPDWLYHFGEPADITFLGLYLNRLSHGYTLLGAIPPSLTQPLDIGRQYWASSLDRPSYYAFRTVLVFLINTVLLSALALQACCMGRIAALEARLKIKPGTASVPTPAA